MVCERAWRWARYLACSSHKIKTKLLLSHVACRAKIVPICKQCQYGLYNWGRRDRTRWNLFLNSEREREMFYLTMHSTHFIYGYMASDIWLRTILIVRKETRCHHIGYSYQLTVRVLSYAPSHRQDNTAFVTPVMEHWLEREIAQWVHPMKDRSGDPSHHERMLYLWATSHSSRQQLLVIYHLRQL